jgi:Alkaline phosphatase PhoX
MKPDKEQAGAVRQSKSTINSGQAVTRAAVIAVSLAAAILAPMAQAQLPAGIRTAVKPYAVSISPEYVAVPILSAGDRVPHTSVPSKQFQMIGVPDGLGAYKAGGGCVVIYMNHEVGGTAISEPVIGEALYRGAFVSKFVLSAQAGVLSGEPAYDVIVDPAGNEVPPARIGNSTPVFVRLCSGSLSWLDAGFDRPIYFCGEENAAPGTFDGKGGLALAIFDKKAYTLPHLGHFPRENTLVRPHPTPETVMILMEDGSAADSQLYMYVAQKDFTPGASPLARNGLVGGKFYAFAANTAGVNTEANFLSGSIAGHWVEIVGVVSMNESQLEAAADAAGAFGFIKSEDGAWSKHEKDEFFFNSTGGAAGNLYGRTYRLKLNEDDITGPCTLTILYNADQVIAAGDDIALSPDNIDVSKDYVMVCEDGAGPTRTLMAQIGREGQIWRYDLKNNYAATPVVSLNPPGRDGVVVGPAPGFAPVGPGVWETSGIIDAEHCYGRNSWLFNVQAHPPTTAPGTNTVEDGQLLLLLPVK